MKRILCLIISIVSAISLYSCNKDTDTNLKSDVDEASITITLENIDRYDSDIFIGTVKSVTPLPDNIEFPNIYISSGEPMLYTIEVQRTLWSLCLEENTTIQVVRTTYDPSISEYWSESLEIGNTYLISGVVQPYNDKPVIVSDKLMLSKLEQDGTLVPISKHATEFMKDIDTLDKLLENEQMKELMSSKADNLPTIFYEEEDTLTTDTAKSSAKKAEAISKIREAIKVDSKTKFKVDFDNYR